MAKRAQPVPPSTQLTAFSCPHCGALTTQHWRRVLLDYAEKDRLPVRIRDAQEAKRLFAELSDPEARESMERWIEKAASGLPFVQDSRVDPYANFFDNVDVSVCYNCDRPAIWVGDQMVWPHANEAPPPNPDLPSDVEADYLEAGEIVNASPRGAAALLRLAIQKLCKHLGEPGKNINDDIAVLVAKGLDPRVQKMLDVVRVVGNNAVHPGEMDLRDDRSTAEQLFVVINLIADIMISQPKAIEAMYGNLPDKAREAIEKRDGQ